MKRYYILISVTIALIILIKLVQTEPLINKEKTESFWSIKTHTKEKFDIIACGDSRVYRGISSDLLSEIGFKSSFINLGYSSAGLSDRYLDFVVSKFNPKAINKTLILGISPHSLTHEAKKNEDLNSYLELSKFDKYRYEYLSPFLQYFSPYSPMNFVMGKRKNYLEEFHTDGWVASNKAFPDSAFALPGYRKTFSKYQVLKEDMTSTIQKLKKIATSGITVIAFRIPTSEQMEILEDSLSGFDESLMKMELKNHNICWLDFSNTQFISYDGSHLTENSARKLSRAIGREINQIILNKTNQNLD